MKYQYRIVYSIVIAFCSTILCWSNNYVIINQVMYDSPLNEKTSQSPYSNGEFIEFYNAGTESVSLQGWTMYGGGSSEQYQFTGNIILPSQGYIILACRRGSDNPFCLSDLYTLPETDNNCIIVYQNKILLSNSGETLTLCNANNDIVDQMTYDGTSNKSKPGHLSAENIDNTPGDECVSLHRTGVEFDKDGKTISGSDSWETSLVTFLSNILPESNYQEDFLLGENYLPADENYVLSITPLDPTSRIEINNGQVSMSSGVRARTSLVYMDGLGRAEQSISLAASPYKEDIVMAVEYADKKNISRQWLPFAMQTNGQRSNPSELASLAQSYYADARPFTEMQYEKSTDRRISRRYMPGESYQSHYAEKTYGINNSSKPVRIYTIVRDSVLKTTGTFYDDGTLYVTTVTDEDGKSVITYTDKLGQKILEDREGNLTYYVYDNLGRQRYILPHLAQAKLTNGEYLPNNAVVAGFSYYYRYDNRGNVVAKQLPGCAAKYFVYDAMGQLVLSQDGNQRIHNQWTVCAYDSVGRGLYTALIPLSQSHNDLITLFADKWQVEHYSNNQSNQIPGIGYGSQILGTNGLKLLTVNYYDNYDYINNLSSSLRQTLRFEQESGFGVQHQNTPGLLTGTRTYNLSEDGYTTSAYYYDAKGQVIQSRSILHDGGNITTSTKYLFDGSIALQSIKQDVDSEFIRQYYRYTYDHVGRVKRTYYRLDNQPEIELSSFIYDSIGHLAQNILYNQKDTIAYTYDIRSMLTETRNKYFSEKLYYADNLPEYTVACYNGNIAAMQLSYIDSICTFAYQYDPLNRLVAAMELSDMGSAYRENFTYDDAGNILTLKRYDHYHRIDDLTYSYGTDDNHIHSIIEAAPQIDNYEHIEYPVAATTQDITMQYDVNGNLTFDEDREISRIHYNTLNMPDTILFVDSSQIFNFYDATGYKYKSISHIYSTNITELDEDVMLPSIESDSNKNIITKYSYSFEITYTSQDTIQRILNSTGYFTPSDSTYYYAIKDHLGNICVVVNATADTLAQRTIFQASGVPMLQSTYRKHQPYLYNGKEFVEWHGYNTYDYGFRGYYATIGRFTSIDPLAEQTPWQSPYAYANNNFINNIDWLGLRAYTTTDASLIADLLDFLQNGGSLDDYDTGEWIDITDDIDGFGRSDNFKTPNILERKGGAGGSYFGNKDSASQLNNSLSRFSNNALNESQKTETKFRKELGDLERLQSTKYKHEKIPTIKYDFRRYMYDNYYFAIDRLNYISLRKMKYANHLKYLSEPFIRYSEL